MGKAKCRNFWKTWIARREGEGAGSFRKDGKEDWTCVGGSQVVGGTGEKETNVCYVPMSLIPQGKIRN